MSETTYTTAWGLFRALTAAGTSDALIGKDLSATATHVMVTDADGKVEVAFRPCELNPVTVSEFLSELK